MKRKGFVVLAVICMVSVVCSIGLLIRLHEVKTKRVYQEILAVSLADARQQAEEYRQAGSDMAYRYLLGDLCVIRDMTARLEAPDSDGIREFYHLAVANPSFLQTRMDEVQAILQTMEEAYNHPNLSNLIHRLRNEAESDI